MSRRNDGPAPDGYEVIFRRFITDKSGQRRYPPNGQRAWRLVVRKRIVQ